jgi:hypothetical protein
MTIEIADDTSGPFQAKAGSTSENPGLKKKNGSGRKKKEADEADEEETAFERVNINCPTALVRALKRIAKKRGSTITEVLKDAIVLEDWLQSQLEAGYDVYKKAPDSERLEEVPLGGRRILASHPR